MLNVLLCIILFPIALVAGVLGLAMIAGILKGLAKGRVKK